MLKRQLLALARAARRSPKVLRLDEARSGVDAERAAEIRGSLRRPMGSCTNLVIAHRLSTVIDADCILMLDRSRIVDSGRRSEMNARGEAFADSNFGRLLRRGQNARCTPLRRPERRVRGATIQPLQSGWIARPPREDLQSLQLLSRVHREPGYQSHAQPWGRNRAHACTQCGEPKGVP